MHKYVLLKNGEIKILWSDNQLEETVTVYNLSELPVNWDLFIPIMETYSYNDVQEIDTSIFLLKLRQRSI